MERERERGRWKVVNGAEREKERERAPRGGARGEDIGDHGTVEPFFVWPRAPFNETPVNATHRSSRYALNA